jgi:glycosyltransferase involved in cell wall biosynthesis
MGKKHIALVSVDAFNPNLTDGGSRAAYEVLRFLALCGHRVSVYHFFAREIRKSRDLKQARFRHRSGAEGSPEIMLFEENVPFRYEEMLNSNACLMRFIKVLDEGRIDLAITLDSDYVSLLAVSILNLPGVHIFNTGYNIEKFKILPPVFAGMLRKRAVLTVSEYLQRRISESLGLSSDVWLNRLNFESRENSRSDNGTAVGFYSSGFKIKGEDIVLRLSERMPGIKFIVVGHPLLSPGESCPPHSNLSNMRWVEDMQPFYGSVRILVVPSLIEEAFSRVIIEAAMRGIPVIANRVGGIPEALGESGIPVDVDLNGPDIERVVEEYKTHIEHLLGNREVYETYIRRALDRAEAYREQQERNSREIYEKYFE